MNPKKLEDLTNNRRTLANSDNVAARTLGAELEKIHSQLAAGEISLTKHKEECTKIRETAEMLVGYDDVGNVGRDFLANLGLQGTDSLRLTDGEYAAITADAGLQLIEQNDIRSTQERLTQAARNEADRGRASMARLFIDVGTAMLEWTQDNPTIFAAVVAGSMGSAFHGTRSEPSSEVASAPGTEVPQQRPGEGGADNPRRH